MNEDLRVSACAPMPGAMTDRSERMRFNIAGIGFELSWEGARLEDEPGLKFYQEFLSTAHHRPRVSHLDVRLQVHCGELPAVNPDALLFDAAPNRWRLYRLNGQYLLEFLYAMPPHPKIQLAEMASDFRSGVIHRRPDRAAPSPSWSLPLLMRPFGELLLIQLLSRGRGVLLHALGVADQGEGLLFIGRSGAGKSTLANLYKPYQSNGEVTILGDERVVVTKKEGRFWLSGTPWPGGGFTVSAATVPLRKVFFLEHGSCNTLIADAHLTLYGLLFQQLFLPFWDGEALAFAVTFAHELITALPAHRLAFVNDRTAVEFLRAQA
jgi:hypothetical protein